MRMTPQQLLAMLKLSPAEAVAKGLLTEAEARKKDPKYFNEKVEIDGELYDSKGEAAYHGELLLRKRAGEISEVERQVDMVVLDATTDPATGRKVQAVTHRVDFMVTMPDGSLEAHEWKGYPTKDWRLKRKMFLARYPGIKYIIAKSERREKAHDRKMPLLPKRRKPKKAHAPAHQ